MRIEQEFIDEDFLYEMLNLSRRKFKKLPANIFMSARNGSKHGPRIKIQNNYAENMQSENTFTIPHKAPHLYGVGIKAIKKNKKKYLTCKYIYYIIQ